MTDTLRALSQENHRIHGAANQPPIDALAYLLGDQVDAYDLTGEVGELREALIAWYRDPSAETISALEAEAADCLIIIDHIVAMCGGRPLIDCVRDKVAADRAKFGATR